MASLQALLEQGRDLQTAAKELEDYWKPRTDAMVKARAFLTSSYRPPMVQTTRWVFTNEPKNLLDLSVAILSGKPPIWRVPMDGADPAQRQKGGKQERFLQGMARQVGRKHRQRGHGGWFQELCWYILMGQYAVFVHMEKGEGKTVEAFWDLWDPIQVFAEPGSGGIQRLYRVYQTERALAVNMARDNGWDPNAVAVIEGRAQRAGPWSHLVRDDTVTVVNAFWMEDGDVVNAVAYDDVLVKEPEGDDTFERIPVVTGPSNGMPFRDFDAQRLFPTIPDWRSLWAESIITSNLRAYEDLDRLLTFMMEITRKHALPTYEDVNEEGTLTVDPSMDLGQLKVIPRKIGETFRPVAPPTAPREREELLQYLIGSIQRGGLSHVAFGSLGIDISGVTLQQLLTATRSKLLPYITTAQDVLGEVGMETMAQFKRLRTPVELAVWSREFGPGAQFMLEDFDPKMDIPDAPYVEPILPLALPDDTMERVQIARQAMGTNDPILDPITILDRIMHEQDPELVFQRIDERLAEQHPIMQAFRFIVAFRKKAQALRDEGRTMEADTAELMAQSLAQQTAAMAAGNGGGPNAEGTPARLREPTPGVQPPEAGPMPPDRFNMAFQRPATPPTRPTTDEDRLRNMGLAGPRG